MQMKVRNKQLDELQNASTYNVLLIPILKKQTYQEIQN